MLVGVGNSDDWCTQNCPPQDCPPRGQFWGGQLWGSPSIAGNTGFSLVMQSKINLHIWINSRRRTVSAVRASNHGNPNRWNVQQRLCVCHFYAMQFIEIGWSLVRVENTNLRIRVTQTTILNFLEIITSRSKLHWCKGSFVKLRGMTPLEKGHQSTNAMSLSGNVAIGNVSICEFYSKPVTI